MTSFLSGSLVWTSQITTLGVDLALRVTALLVLTLTLHALLGPRRSLIRSALWHACLVGLLILPLASIATPRMRIACLPMASLPPSKDLAETLHVPLAPRLAGSDAPTVDEVRASGPEEVLGLSPALPDAAPANPTWRPGGVEALVLGYGAGATLLLLRLIGSLAAVARLRRSCVAVEGPVWKERLEYWQTLLEISRRVELLASDRLAVPVVVGWLHPAIVLPASLAGSAASERLDAVLIHELAHVRRRDYAWNILLRVLQVVYWPHPLLWISGWVMNLVRERACDDFCIATLPDGAVYRNTLLELAQGLVRRPGPALGLAMARVSKLGHRLAWIARSSGNSRCQIGWHGRAAFFGSIVAAVFLLAAIELTRASAESPSAAVQESATQAAAAPQAQGHAIDFRVVRDEDRMPLAGAIVKANVVRGRGKESRYTTDAEGRCRIPLPAETPAAVVVTAASPGYVPLEVVWSARELRTDDDLSYTLALRRGSSVGGLVHDEQGRPIAGVKVQVDYRGRLTVDGKATFARTSAPAATTDAQGRWRAEVLPTEARPNDVLIVYLEHPEYVSNLEMPSREVRVDKARAREDVQVMKVGAPITGTVLDPAARPVEGAAVVLAYGRSNVEWRTTRSDALGQFRFDHVDETETYQFGPLAVLVEAAGFAPAVREVAAQPERLGVRIKLETGRPLSGRVVDRNGDPVGGAAVTFQSYQTRNGWTWMGSTDADGRFTWPDGPVAGEVTLRVFKAPYKDLLEQKAPAGGRGATITLFGSQRLRGTVVDAETGAPIDLFTLIPGWSDGHPRRQVIWLGGGHVRKLTGGRFDETGMFTSRGTSLWLRAADGYLPDVAPPFSDADAEVTFAFKLRKAAGLSGIVRGPDGAPMEGADVCLASKEEYINFQNGGLFVGGLADKLGVHATTGPDGRYHLGPADEPSGLLVVHDRGFARLSAEEVARSADVQLQPWGRIVGTLTIGAQPGALQPVGAYVLGPMGPGGREESYDYSAKTDSVGRFVWDRVAPGEVTVHRVFTLPSGDGTLWSHLAHVTVRPGETVAVALGGGGRPVVGRVAGPGGTVPVPHLANRNSMLSVKVPPIPTPADFASFSPEQKRKWLADFRKTEAGRAHDRRMNRFAILIDHDGTFRAEDVPPGTFNLRVALSAGEPGRPTTVAIGGKEVAVPEGPADQPFDVGRVELEFRNFRTLNVNDPVPLLSTRTFDDRPLDLANYRGKYVLLDFWATWCSSCLEETPFLKATFDAFGKDERFVMIGLSLDQRAEVPKKYVAEHALNWIQGFLGMDPPSPVTEDFGVTSVSQVMLIDPDGKLVAKDLHGEQIKAAVAAALGKRE